MKNKEPRIKTSSFTAEQISNLILNDKMSPYSVSMVLKEKIKNKYVSSPRTIYNIIDAGLLKAKHGGTPYHPGKKKKPRIIQHPAKTVPGRNSIADRPEEADRRACLGHLEMDTIFSSSKGKGGILCTYDRKSRRYCVEKLNAVSQDEVIRALKRLRKRGTIIDALSVATDNGCEFLSQAKLEDTCKVYYTRAYSEDGSQKEPTSPASSAKNSEVWKIL